ncbi:hypothetical protein ACFW9N_29540 [Streptomyces sp. NPDC059496]|uniref:hypothetical protein n=1 Tax=Streptomyces sp. NPDC059496 TaxID=3346851 RepID=UPI0036B5D49E
MFDQRAQDRGAEGGGFVECVDDDGQRPFAVAEGVEEFTDGANTDAGGRSHGVQDVGVGQTLGVDGDIDGVGCEQVLRQAERIEGDDAAAFGVGESGDQTEDCGLAGTGGGGDHPARRFVTAVGGVEPGGEVVQGVVAAAEPPGRGCEVVAQAALVAHGAYQQAGGELGLAPLVLMVEGGSLLEGEVDLVEAHVVAGVGEEGRRITVQADRGEPDPLVAGPVLGAVHVLHDGVH